jgi:hypothetical protein
VPRLPEAHQVRARVAVGQVRTIGDDHRELRILCDGLADHRAPDVEGEHDRTPVSQRARRDTGAASAFEDHTTAQRFERVEHRDGMVGTTGGVLIGHRIERDHTDQPR